jgi:hypothetical protein
MDQRDSAAIGLEKINGVSEESRAELLGILSFNIQRSTSIPQVKTVALMVASFEKLTGEER